MRSLEFPGLGLEFAMERVAFTILGRPVYWYGLIIAMGFLLAVLVCCKLSHRFGIRQEDITDMLLAAVPLALVGARGYYILFYLDLYRRSDGGLDIPAMLRVWDGGLAIYGGVIAAVLVLFVFCRLRKISFLAFADLGVFGLFIGQSVGRWGNFVNMEAYGGVTELPWRMCSAEIAGELLDKGLVDTAAYQSVLDGSLGVHPTFFYESLWNLVGLGLLFLLLKLGRKFDGQLFLTYLFWYGLGRAWIEGLRTDSLYLFETGLRVSQLLAVLSCVTAVVCFVLLKRKKGYAPLYVETLAAPGKEQGTISQGEEEEREDGCSDGRQSTGGETTEGDSL